MPTLYKCFVSAGCIMFCKSTCNQSTISEIGLTNYTIWIRVAVKIECHFKGEIKYFFLVVFQLTRPTPYSSERCAQFVLLV